MARDRIDRRMLVVERGSLEGLAGSMAGTSDHVGELTGDVEVTAAVVPDVENQILDARAFQRRNRVDEGLLRRR